MNNQQAKRGRSSKAYRDNRKIVLSTQDVCYLCSFYVDKSLPYGDPLSAEIDHIIPVVQGGSITSLDNLGLTHRFCNRLKYDKTPTQLMRRQMELFVQQQQSELGSSKVNWLKEIGDEEDGD